LRTWRGGRRASVADIIAVETWADPTFHRRTGRANAFRSQAAMVTSYSRPASPEFSRMLNFDGLARPMNFRPARGRTNTCLVPVAANGRIWLIRIKKPRLCWRGWCSGSTCSWRPARKCGRYRRSLCGLPMARRSASCPGRMRDMRPATIAKPADFINTPAKPS